MKDEQFIKPNSIIKMHIKLNMNKEIKINKMNSDMTTERKDISDGYAPMSEETKDKLKETLELLRDTRTADNAILEELYNKQKEEKEDENLMHDFNKMIKETFEEINKMNNTTEKIQDKVTIIDLNNLPDFLGGTLVEKLKKFLEYKDQGIDVFNTAVININEKPFKDENPISKEYFTGGDSSIKIITPVEFAGSREEEDIKSILDYIKATQDTTSKRLSGCITNDPKLTGEIKEAIKQTEEELFGAPLSPLQTWIENGKDLVEQEIEDAEDYVEELQDQINILQIEINRESKRIDNLVILFETISL